MQHVGQPALRNRSWAGTQLDTKNTEIKLSFLLGKIISKKVPKPVPIYLSFQWIMNSWVWLCKLLKAGWNPHHMHEMYTSPSSAQRAEPFPSVSVPNVNFAYKISHCLIAWLPFNMLIAINFQYRVFLYFNCCDCDVICVLVWCGYIQKGLQ